MFGEKDKRTDKLIYISSLNLVVITLLKDMEQLDKKGQLSLDDFTRILKIMSGSIQYRHLITNEYLWKDFIIKNVERMNLNNIYDIEIVLQNLDSPIYKSGF